MHAVLGYLLGSNLLQIIEETNEKSAVRIIAEKKSFLTILSYLYFEKKKNQICLHFKNVSFPISICVDFVFVFVFAKSRFSMNARRYQ